MNQTLPCCGYDNPEAVKFNPHNGVIQCHNCGQVYTPQRQHEPCPFVVSTKEGTHYCALSQRQWVGLTDEERESIADATIRIHGQEWAYATAIEAKLREKNT